MTKRAKVLVVDDSDLNRLILSKMLDERYDILEASGGEAALNMLWEYGQEISLVLLDIVMPDINGFDILRKMNEEEWMIRDIPVIVVSASSDNESLNEAFALGAKDFIPRPFNSTLVKKRVENSISLFSKQRRLENMVAEEIYENTKRSSLMIMVLSHIVEFRNKESGMHVVNINAITRAILKHLQQTVLKDELSDSEISDITIASSLHDIGKIRIPESILNKAGRLTAEEYAVMKTHSMAGAKILEEIPFGKEDNLMKVAYEICRWHHERFDGNGYPDGLTGDEIPLAAQVVGLADVYDALTSNRIYKPAYSHEQAVEMIRGGECGIFSDMLLKCFSEIAEQLPYIIANEEEEFRVRDDARQITRERYGKMNLDSTQQTIERLEFEQKKAQFYTSITHDILFDYTVNPSILTISAHGCHKFGLPSVIYHPLHNQDVLRVISEENIHLILDTAKSLAHENMRGRLEIRLNHEEHEEWNRVVLKPILSHNEEHSFVGLMGVISNIDDEYQKLLAMTEKASVDGMTQLTNKSTMEQLIRTKMEENPELEYCMMILDVDNLKTINDTRGHSTGDEYLKLVAKRMKTSTRSGDLNGRVGGDEFMIFFPCSKEPDAVAHRIYERIIDRSRGYGAPELMEELQFSISAGFAATSNVGRDYNKLFKAADKALYQVKRNGKGDCLGFVEDGIHDN